jgi:xanthine dehydrogenase iron-sulfur cluster and FAD-binding subunit A
MWESYLRPGTFDEALEQLRRHAGTSRIVAGGTDVLVELSRGVRPTTTLIDITALRDLRYVRADAGTIYLGALATHNDVVASGPCVERALPLAQSCWEVGAPQIRTRATVAGNLVTASPANDTIAPLLALGATVALTRAGEERVLSLDDFYLGLRRTALRPDELLREIRVPGMSAGQRGLFLKLGLRRAQAISVVNVAIVLTFDGDMVSAARIVLGCVAPTVVRIVAAEEYLIGRRLDDEVCREAGRLSASGIAPIDDVRGPAWYRRDTVAVLVAEGLHRIAAGTEAAGWIEHPVLLDSGNVPGRDHAPFNGVIRTTINGRPYDLHGAQGKTLLNALREDAGLTGTKEGCAEGECGACTVWLDGQAVMSCLVPAPQAHGAALTTIEGLGGEGCDLHPLQQAFIDRGAVQCGYCIPGMLMAGAKLLQERPAPTPAEVQIGLSGNLCRCTGYRKILDAVLAAGGRE